jgi:hypothetical protein
MLRLLVLVSAAHGVAQLPPLSLLPEHARHGTLAQGFDASPLSPSSEERWLRVPLDWHAPHSAPEFAVRYFVDESHFDASDDAAPIFVGMGGEGGTSRAACTSYPTGAVARHHALCVAIEHRFYGASVPRDGGVSTANYAAGLSVEANLHDTAAVIAALRAAYPTASATTPRPVLTFGGSYSGATCAWFRQAYPEASAGCVASSGVVNAIFAFRQFDEHVATALGPGCAAQLRAAQAAIDRALDAGGGDRVKALFNATNLIGTPTGDADFLYAIADGPAMLDQYGRKAVLCDGLAALPADPTDAQRVAGLAAILARAYGPRFTSACFYDTACVANASAAAGGSGGLTAADARSWRWQKCTELAYLQAAPADGRVGPLRSPRLTMAVLLAQCDRAFGVGTTKRLLAANRLFNARYGGADPTKATLPTVASEIFYLDFSDDPWAEASVRSTHGSSLRFCMTTCDGCGHCGSGVPQNMTHCYDAADNFVASVLAKWPGARPAIPYT